MTFVAFTCIELRPRMVVHALVVAEHALINPWWVDVFLAPVLAMLATILIFMDQQITAVIVNRKEHKLKKGGGYHLDLLVRDLIQGASIKYVRTEIFRL